MKSIGIRMNKKLLKKINKLSEEENLDRSTITRKLIHIGYTDYQKNKAAEKYKKELITLSQAAKESNTTLWEFQKYLIEKGYTSTYSLKDLKEETQNL